MAKIISVTNEKGGVGKTTTSAQMVSYFAKHGKRVLAIDMDPQAQLSIMFGFFPKKIEDKNKTIFELLNGVNSKTKEIKASTLSRNFVCKLDETESYDPSKGLADWQQRIHFFVGTERMAGIDGALTGVNMFNALRSALRQKYKAKDADGNIYITSFLDNYDYVIIDTSPYIGVSTYNAIVASDGVVIPYEAKPMTKFSTIMIARTLKEVQDESNPELQVYGVLPTRCTLQTNVAKNAIGDAQTLADMFGTKVFSTPIREMARLAALVDVGKDIFDYDKNSPSAVEYARFCRELLSDLGDPVEMTESEAIAEEKYAKAERLRVEQKLNGTEGGTN